MIKSFHDIDTKNLFNLEGGHPSWQSFEKVARRKLLLIDAAQSIIDLQSPPGNKLEKLKGKRAGQYSIRINDAYRVCFTRGGDGFCDVEITNYHDE